MRKDYRIEVTLSLVAPVITQGLEGRLLGVDTAAWQVEQDGQLYPALPASLIRGNLRHAWQRLAILAEDACMPPAALKAWMGDEAQEDADNAPQRARLRSSDHWQASLPTHSELRYRIALDDETGAVQRGAIQVIESPYPAGQVIDYSGWFEISADEAEVNTLRQQIEQGLQFVPALGAFKNIGFGRIQSVRVGQPQVCEPVRLELADTDCMGLVLHFDRPFCFAKPHAGDNRFESETHVSGAALKGAVLNRISQLDNTGEGAWSSVRRWIDVIRFSHAFPAHPHTALRGLPVPLSLYADGNSHSIRDAALDPAQALTGGKAPKFQLDWKSEWDVADPVFSGLDAAMPLPRGLRVRTAIEAESQAAADEKLFAQAVIATHQHVWLSNVSLHQVDASERAIVQAELTNLLGYGLNGLGKTRAMTRRIDLREMIPPTVGDVTSATVLSAGQHLRLLLVTPARLLPDQLTLPASNGGQQLLAEYAQSWGLLSGNSFRLVRFFARQQLYGGDYYYHRFRHPKTGGAYNPLLLTEAGSVFVLEVVEAASATAYLQEWQHNGLPQLPDIAGGDNWQTNPLLGANGYGEIHILPEMPPIPLPKQEEKPHV